MSTISRLYTTTISNTRQVWSGNLSSDTAVGSFSGHVQQARPELAESLGETWSKVFSIWCAVGTDVSEGDKLTIASGNYAGTYHVQQIQKNAVGINAHLELVVTLVP
ncbi:MAG: hypothetical protein Tp172MES00d2C118482111_2 [Prokaryotic dsDNA virus sp.]|nr:MAG: hypothetical protein Tp172MES00d2C118482111_2 [Prokaryotic dsDNA virus sp.]|tara:strand:- start:15524 stop:15844 length:321 start_codon:yes stop_codon:yes gene_type:complete